MASKQKQTRPKARTPKRPEKVYRSMAEIRQTFYPDADKQRPPEPAGRVRPDALGGRMATIQDAL